MVNQEMNIIEAFWELIPKSDFERISAVLWIHGIEFLENHDKDFKEFIRIAKHLDSETPVNFTYMFTTHNILRLVNIVCESPLFKTLGYSRNLIHILCELFLWSVLTNCGSMFGYGFGGVGKMKASIIRDWGE